VIDFELARPGLPEENVVFAALRVAHLRPDGMARAIGFDGVPDRTARLEAFANAYGRAPEWILTHAVAVQTAELDRIAGWGGAGIEPWASFLARGLDRQVRSELIWLEENASTLL